MVYYKKNDSGWVFLGEVSAEENLNFKIYHSDVGDGLYEFAIRAIYSNELNSSLHTSKDLNANPIGGWCLLWIRSK